MGKIRKWLIDKLGGTDVVLPSLNDEPIVRTVPAYVELVGAELVVPTTAPEEEVKSIIAGNISDWLLENNYIKWEITDVSHEYSEPRKRYAAKLRVVKANE